MSAKDDQVPPDQFERVLAEMRRLATLFDEVEQGINLARGIKRHEASRALDEARSCVEVAQYWMRKAIAAAKQSDPT